MKTGWSLGSVVGVTICAACSGTPDRAPPIDDFVAAPPRDDDDDKDPTGALANDASNGVDQGDGGDGISSDRAADGASTDDEGSGITPEQAGRRLGLPCDPPFPTGYCAVSDEDDGIGQGKGYSVVGDDVVSIQADKNLNEITMNIQDEGVVNGWSLRMISPSEDALKPDLYESAQRFDVQSEAIAGFDFSGDGRGCNELEATFSIEELEVDPSSGITRMSVTFEQHCEGSTAAMRGVVNFQATGTPDLTLLPAVSLELGANVVRTAYGPEAHLAYGVDATNRKLLEIDLEQGVTQEADTPQAGNDLCLDEKRGRIYIVNRGSSVIAEHQVSDLSLVREIEWTGTEYLEEQSHFKIYCAPDKVYVIDAAAEPALFTIEDLDADTPMVTEHPDLTGVGALTFTQDGSELYYSKQIGWGAGWAKSFATRLDATSLTASDTSGEDVFFRDPVDAPILLDEAHGLLFAKNVVFDAQDFTNVLYTFPSNFDESYEAFENAYAIDDVRGLMATKNFVYELGHYTVVSPTLKRLGDQLFFDRDGGLWFLEVASGTLEKQLVDSPFD